MRIYDVPIFLLHSAQLQRCHDTKDSSYAMSPHGLTSPLELYAAQPKTGGNVGEAPRAIRRETPRRRTRATLGPPMTTLTLRFIKDDFVVTGRTLNQ